MDTILLCGGHMDDAFVLGCIENIGPDCIIGIDRGWNSVTGTGSFPSISWAILTVSVRR